MSGFVYIIAAGHGPRKIGMGGDPKKRLQALQTAHYDKLTLEYCVETHAAAMVEREAHALLASKRLSGEWFDVSDGEAFAALALAKATVDARRVEAGRLRVVETISIGADQQFLDSLDEAARWFAASREESLRFVLLEFVRYIHLWDDTGEPGTVTHDSRGTAEEAKERWAEPSLPEGLEAPQTPACREESHATAD